jgi:hypothetical protein
MADANKDKVNQCAFEVDGRVRVLLDHDLAISLGMLILSTDTKNSAILALGHQLRNFVNKAKLSNMETINEENIK